MEAPVSLIQLSIVEASEALDAVTTAIDHYADLPDAADSLLALQTDLECFVDPTIVGGRGVDRDKFFWVGGTPAWASRHAEILQACVDGGRLPPNTVRPLLLLAERLRRAHLVVIDGGRQ